MSITLRAASEQDRDVWNRFVDCEQGSFFQYYEWKYFYEYGTARRRFIPLCIEDSDAGLLGIFPLVENRNGYYPTLTSLPEGSSNGFIIKGTLSPARKREVAGTFLKYIDETFSQSHAVISLQGHVPPPYSEVEPSKVLLENGYTFEGDLATRLPGHFVLPLKKPFEEIFSGMQKRLRTTIRKTMKEGAEVVTDRNFAYFDPIIALQVGMVRKFGESRVKADYQPVLDIFRKKMKLFVCLSGGEPVSGLLCFYTPATAFWWIGPYRSTANNNQNNLLPICAAIRDACESGYQYFDMGITVTPSLAGYKEKFGAACIPIMPYKKTFSPVKMAVNKTVLALMRNNLQ